MTYHFLFVGLGSIGKRHLKNVCESSKSKNVNVTIDVVRSGYGASLAADISALINKIYSYEDSITENYSAVFITNPTALHYETLKKYAHLSKKFFIEKPVFDGTDYSIKDLNLPADAVCYVACPLRYNKVLQYVKQNIDCTQAFSVRSICSSYLPDWRPDTDYRKTYSAHKAMGGGVSIDLIHEWDYLSWLFGMPQNVISMIDKVSGLEIDSDDLAVYIGKNDNTAFELHLDYFGRQTIRQLQIFLPNDTILADIAGGTVSYLKEQRTIELHEERNAFQLREIEHFFDIINGKCRSDNTIDEAVQILKIAKGEIGI